ncbi:hypothetical protein CDD81_3220 [Ophiocordyceps australis]|uniref:RNase III domain-containing protein n=1 Tax=Ophiocordyceps australis TaxID=1399860 RepID=A0A2C5XWC6_9HYPO|nr:hypothetical protein CDD81_3220 [Ophiocordyceps australis]
MAVQPCRRSLLAQGRHVVRCASAQPRPQRRSLHSQLPPSGPNLPPPRKPLKGPLRPTHDTDKWHKTRGPLELPLAQLECDLEAPRWQATPRQMKARVPLDFAKNPRNKEWEVNKSPERLDEMYERLLGSGGEQLLPEELKWLAVTHKSFDYGRRGFNDKLAIMGRFTMVLEATKFSISKDPMQLAPDQYNREPFRHAQLASIDNLSIQGPKNIVGLDRLYQVAIGIDLLSVMRWKPRLPRNLKSSGVKAVLTGGIMAIVGALTLQHGSVVASKLIQECILPKIPQPLDREGVDSVDEP